MNGFHFSLRIMVGSGLLCAALVLSAASRASEPKLASKRGLGKAAPEPVDVKKLTLDLLHLKTARTALNEQREGLASQVIWQTAEADEDLGKLRLRLGELLSKLSRQGPAAPLPADPMDKLTLPPLPVNPVEPKAQGKPFPVPEQPLEPFALAEVLYQSGDVEGALKAFRRIDLTGLRAEERVPIQYLIATCLRKTGKSDEATALYPVVADSRSDPMLAECAQWQLSSLRWQKDVEGRVQALKQRRQAVEKQP